MRSFISLFAVMAILSLSSYRSPAQTTLQTYIGDVIDSNPSIAVSQAVIEEAEAGIGRASAWEPPMVAARLMDVPLSEVNPFAASGDRRFSLEQRIPFPGKKSSEEDMAEGYARMAKADRSHLLLTLRAAATIEYVRASGYIEQIMVLREQEKLLQDMIGSVSSRYAVGKVRQADLLRLRIQHEDLHNMLASVESNLQNTYDRMNELRGKNPGTTFGVLGPVDAGLPAITLDSLSALAEARRPDLARVKALRFSADASRSLAGRSFWPDLMIGAGYRNSPVMGNSWEIMFGVSIPIVPWSSGSVTGAKEQTEARMRQADASLTERMLASRKETSSAYRTMTLHYERLERYTQKIIPNAEQSMESLRAAYLTDQADFLSFLDSFRNLESLYIDMIYERVQFLTALARLEETTGTDLFSADQGERP